MTNAKQDDAVRRDEVLRRMLNSPPQPKKGATQARSESKASAKERGRRDGKERA